MAYKYTETSKLTDVGEGTLVRGLALMEFADPMVKCAWKFALAAAHSLRCKVGVPRNCTPGLTFYLYTDDCPLAYARVGYGAVQESNTDNFYYVRAPAVNNERYADYNYLRHMTMTKSFDKALQNVRRYVRRPNLLTLANHYWSSIARTNFDSEASEERQELTLKAHMISNQDATLLELENLYRSGHEFTVATLAERVREWVAAKDEAALSSRDRTDDVVFVHFRPNGSHQACRFRKDVWGKIEAEYAVLEDLPEPVTRRIAALTICEDNSHVNLVGTRIAADCFVVYA
jgi:hypothetical protein